ncbi:MAG TPA: hypothetical protein VGK90_08460, partial [Rhizomicrobium sp.]
MSANGRPLKRFLLLLGLSLAAMTSTSSSPAIAGQCNIASPASPLPAAKFDDGPMIAPSVLVIDFDGWISGMRQLNPDLSIRANIPELDAEAARIRAELTKPMSRREAWIHFARLNPYLRDAHAGIQMPNYRMALEAHVKNGGRIVPIEVRFAKDGSLRVFTVASDTAEIKQSDIVVSINGYSTDRMIADMMSLAIGETTGVQRAWVARRFAMLFWYLYGDTGQYDVVVRSPVTECPHEIRMMGGAVVPEAQQDSPTAQELFDWRILDNTIGYLRVDGFDPDKKEAFDKFTQSAFAAFKAQNIR